MCPTKKIHDMQIALPHATYEHHEGSPVQPSPAIQATSKTAELPINKQKYPDLLDAEFEGHPLPKPAETMPAKPEEYGNSVIATPDKDVCGTRVTINSAMYAKM